MDADLLNYEEVTEIINSFEVDDNLRLLSSGIMPESSGRGRVYGWDVKDIRRDVSNFEGWMAKSSPRALQTYGHQTANLIRSAKDASIDGAELLDLREPGTTERMPIMETRVAEELAGLRELMDRQDEFLIARALTGEIDVKVDGIDHTIDYGFDTFHTFFNGNVDANIPTLWSNPGADVIGDLTRAKVVIAETSGKIARRAYCSSEVMMNIAKNDQFINQIGQTQLMATMLQTGKISPFWELEWIVYDGTFVNEAGAVERLVPKDTILLTPGPDRSAAFMRVGSNAVPTGPDGQAVEAIGLSVYAEHERNPVRTNLIAVKTRLPIIRIPKAFGTMKVL